MAATDWTRQVYTSAGTRQVLDMARVAARLPGTQRIIPFAQRRQQVRERLQRKNDPLPQGGHANQAANHDQGDGAILHRESARSTMRWNADNLPG